MVVVGSLACQRDSYLRELKTVVVSCVAGEAGKWVVEFEDTVLFPKGGGQPCDYGVIRLNDGGEVKCTEVRRNKLRAEHVLDRELSPGEEVTMTVDWARRYDHMQQHTGQHLVSALSDRDELETLSWSLEEKICFIEIPRKLTDEEVMVLQKKVNDAIQAAKAVYVELVTDYSDADTSHIPADYDFEASGSLRMVKIDGIDSNLCCGTHLKNTAELGAFVVMNQTPGKGKNWRVHYVIGSRSYLLLAEYNRVMRAIGCTLSCGPADVVEKVNYQQATVKNLVRKVREQDKVLGRKDAPNVREELLTNQKAIVARDDPSPDFFSSLLEHLNKLGGIPPDSTLLLLGGKQPCAVQIIGHDATAYGNQAIALAKTLKGGGQATRWNGKVADQKELKAFQQNFLTKESTDASTTAD